MQPVFPEVTKKLNDASVEHQQELRNVHLTHAEKTYNWNKMMLFMEENSLPNESRQEQEKKKSDPGSRPAVAITVMALLVLAAALIIPFSAEQSLPDSPLYPVKTGVNEQIHSAFVFSDSQRESWLRDQALRRLEEADKLLKKNAMTTNIEKSLVREFNKANAALLSKSKLGEDTKILKDYQNRLEDYTTAFEKKLQEDTRASLQSLVTNLKVAMAAVAELSNENGVPKGTTSQLQSTTNKSILITVTSEKSVYKTGEQIRLTIAAKNTGQKTETFNFKTGCQATYSINNENLGSQFCTQALTSFTLAPGLRREWAFITAAPPKPGIYTITGEVIGHGKTSITFTVISD